MRGPHILNRAALDGILASEQVIQQNAEAVQIALHRRRLAAEHFGRKVERRPGQIRRRAVVELAPGAKIHQHDAAVLGARDVVGLDVAMQETCGVDGRHRTTELDADRDRVRGVERRASSQLLLERLAAHELHPQADLIADPLGAVNRHDVRVADPREQPALFDDRR